MTTSTSTSTILSDSISSLSSASSAHPPSISRTFKQAQQLFISRQLADAWDVLVPVVTPPPRSNLNAANGTDGVDSFYQTSIDGSPKVRYTPTSASAAAPIAQATRSARIKVWSLYIALVHAILELGLEEGSKVMEEATAAITQGMNGGKRWKELSRRVREGEVWDEVVRDGYSGVEGAVEGEVICNLATLLLTHAPSQKLTQSRLESYLSAASSGPPPSQLASTLEQHQQSPSSFSKSQSATQHSHAHSANGTSTPRDLSTRLKLLEIFTLHVLPRNEEWDYAREFINMSEVLDEERKEAFLAALGTLRDSSAMERRREEELMKRREEESKAPTASERTNEDAVPGVRERDFGIEAGQGRVNGVPAASSKGPSSAANGRTKTTAQNGHASTTPASSKPARSSQIPAASSSAAVAAPKPARKVPTGPGSKRLSPASATNSTTLFGRAQYSVQALQRLLNQTAHSLTRNPMPVLRFLLFIVALVIGLARRDVRERLSRAWEKIRATAGMGAKVGYL